MALLDHGQLVPRLPEEGRQQVEGIGRRVDLSSGAERARSRPEPGEKGKRTARAARPAVADRRTTRSHSAVALPGIVVRRDRADRRMLGRGRQDSRLPGHGNAQEDFDGRRERRRPMSECSAVTERMPLLLTESLDATRRELTHQHIESCDLCGAEWSAYKQTWLVMGDLPEMEVPARVKARFLSAAGILQPDDGQAVKDNVTDNVVPFRRRPAVKW